MGRSLRSPLRILARSGAPAASLPKPWPAASPFRRPVHEAAQGPWPPPCPASPREAGAAAQAALAAGPASPPYAGFLVLQFARWCPGEHIDAPVELPTGDAPAGASGAARLIAHTEHFGDPQWGRSVRAAQETGPWVRIDDGPVGPHRRRARGSASTTGPWVRIDDGPVGLHRRRARGSAATTGPWVF